MTCLIGGNYSLQFHRVTLPDGTTTEPPLATPEQQSAIRVYSSLFYNNVVAALKGVENCRASILKSPNKVVGMCWLQRSITVMSCGCQTARRVGERERQTSAEDKGGPPIQAAHRHSRAAGPQHLQVRMWKQNMKRGGCSRWME